MEVKLVRAKTHYNNSLNGVTLRKWDTRYQRAKGFAYMAGGFWNISRRISLLGLFF